MEKFSFGERSNQIQTKDNSTPFRTKLKVEIKLLERR